MVKEKIKFNLEGYNVLGFKKPSMFEYDSDEECVFATMERIGILLGISTQSFQKEDGAVMHFPCAVVKDDKDGKVYLISPTNIQFINL
ncbi:MAG: hypothetical protein IKO26_03465 [Paludibacteraceae bacterium]|nr:hypothetical protein [Paludibacteraceae bacterium]